MKKRIYVVVGTIVYVAAIVLPFIVLIGIGLFAAATLTTMEKTQLQWDTGGREMSWASARTLTFLVYLKAAGYRAAYMAVIGGVPFGLYLAVVNMLSSNPRVATPSPEPIQDVVLLDTFDDDSVRPVNNPRRNRR